MEKLEFSSNGQWTLVKSKANPDADDHNSYLPNAREGRLPQDSGRRGMLNNTSNTRPERHNSEERMSGTVPTPVRSADDARKPGSPGPAGDRKRKVK